MFIPRAAGTVSFAVAGAVYVSLIPLARAGDIYNGPERSGISIPTALDRDVTVSEIKKIVPECLARTYQNLLRQMPNTSNLKFDAVDCLSTDDGFRAGENVAQASCQALVSGDSAKGYFGVFVLDNAVTASYKIPSQTDYINLTAPFPALRYTVKLVGDSYDEYGRPIDPHWVAKSPHLDVPDVFGPAVPLVNQETGHTSKLSLNMEEYRDCVAAKIQE